MLFALLSLHSGGADGFAQSVPAAPDAEARKSVTVTDKEGRSIDIPLPVRRAVFISLYEFIPGLRLWDRVVGINRWAEHHPLLEGEVRRRNLPLVGTGSDVNMEALMALAPDLVITWTYKPEAAEFMTARGLKVIAIYPDNLDELYGALDMCGRLFSEEARARDIRTAMEEVFSLVESRTGALPPERRRSVLWLWQEPTRVSGSRSLQHDIMQRAGAVNLGAVFDERHANISLERIVEMDPEVIFIWGHATYGPERLLSSPQWASIRAVREKKVYKAPKLDTWSPAVALVTLWTAEKVYPELFRDIPLHDFARAFYDRTSGSHPERDPWSQEATAP